MTQLHRVELQQHPDSAPAAVGRVQVAYDFDGENWRLVYELHGDIASLGLSEVRRLRSGKDLWQHTCFELFIGTSSHHYRELNIAPDGAWAGYDFSGYRAGRRNVENELIASVHSHQDASRYRMEVLLHGSAVPDMARHVGIATIVQAADGGYAYWALEHAPGAPDFHHVKSFRIPLN